MAVVEVTVVCDMHYLFTFLFGNIFLERAAQCKGAMIVSLFFKVDTLPDAGNAFMVHMFLRGT